MSRTATRLINKWFDSNATPRYRILDLVCQPDKEGAKGREEDEEASCRVREFLSLLYLGLPPKGSVFNKDGSARSKKELCTFLGEHDKQLWKIILKLIVHGFYRIFFAGGFPWMNWGETAKFNSTRMTGNKNTIATNLEPKVKMTCLKTPRVIDALEKNDNVLRYRIMKRPDFTIYMLVNANGELRSSHEMKCASKWMNKSLVSDQLKKYYVGLSQVVFGSNTPNMSSFVSDINLKSIFDKGVFTDYQCKNNLKFMKGFPDFLNAVGLKMILMSNAFIHVDVVSSRPLLIDVGNAINVKKVIICKYVLQKLESIIDKDIVKRLWLEGKLKVSFEKEEIDKRDYNLIYVKMPSKYLPKPRAYRDAIKNAITFAGVVGFGGLAIAGTVKGGRAAMKKITDAAREWPHKSEEKPVEELEGRGNNGYAMRGGITPLSPDLGALTWELTPRLPLAYE